jgi:alanyl-tRNA synthetase
VPTARLYHADSFRQQFTATALAHGAWKGRPALVLDQTAFYPEAGGQMADRGQLGGLAVVDVQVDDAGVVHHVIEVGALPAIGATVDGAIEWPRRRQNMALHTGQHVLSRALVDPAGAGTVSTRLGDSGCTIDVDAEKLDDAALAAAEDLANAVVDDDVPIRCWFPEPAELAALPLRREPKVDSDVRVIAIGDFDVSPCGGTHCASSGQIGPVRILGSERYKGLTRITFSAGKRARVELAARDAALRGLAATFTCGPLDVPAAVDKLRRDLAATAGGARELRDRLAEALAAGLVAPAHAGPVVAAVPGDAELLRAMATRITATGKDALLAATSGDGTAVLVARAAGSALDAGRLLGTLAKKAGGRGGGKPDRAEGRLPAGVDWPGLVADALATA